MRQYIPATADLNIENFSGATITELGSYIENGVIGKYPEGTLYVTQRPSFTTVQDASAESVGAKGRGIYYWRLENKLYLVNDGVVYVDNYSNAVAAAADTITTLDNTTTGTGTTATVTITAHTYQVGNRVTIAGADQTEYNGTYTVTSTPTANTFTYEFAGSATSPATTSTTLTATHLFGTGTSKVYWAELADKLAILDIENNEAWYIDDGAPTVLVPMSDANFPDVTNGRTLANGAAVLDGTMYVMANVDANTNAEIWGSDLFDLTSWDELNFVTAAKNSDRGVYIGTHQNNVFVLGNESLEFFQNVANPTGSPLGARQDIFYNVGCADGKSVFIDNDIVFFVAKSSSSGLSVQKLEKFQLVKISNESLDSYLNTVIALEELSVVGSGVFVGGRVFYILTVYTTTSSGIVPHETFVYNNETGTWSFWEHASSAVDQFPLIQWVKANDVSGDYIQTGKGILSNGDYLESYDDFFPQDRTRGFSVFETSAFESGVFSDVATTGDQIVLKVRIGHTDFDTRERKFMSFLRPVCDQTLAAQTLRIRYSNDNHDGMGSWREVNVGNANDKLSRLGQFRSRTFDLEFSGDEALRIQALEAEVQLEGAGGTRSG